MSKKIITCVLTLAMIFGVFSNPALGYATAAGSSAGQTTAIEKSDSYNAKTTNTVKVSKVKNVKAKALDHKRIKLTWTPVKGASKYYVYRYNSSKGKYVRIKTVRSASMTDSNLKKATRYTYKVRAVASSGAYGDCSAAVRCKTNPYLTKPVNIRGYAISSSCVKVSWNRVPGAKWYQVYRYDKSSLRYKLYITTSKTYLNNIKLKADTAYSYKIRAYVVQDGKRYYSPFSSGIRIRTEKTDGAKIVDLAKSKLKCQYKYGAKGPKKFDCSGFVTWVYNNADLHKKVKLPATNSSGLYSALDDKMIGRSIKSIDKAKMGDILFFKYGGRVSHVGIYYKNGKMIHAANPKKDVCIEKVSDYNKWGYKVVGIARVL